MGTIGAALPRPKAILSVSAHWYIEDAAVTVSTAPRATHDFGGFPRKLYQAQYPAPGDPSRAARVQKLLAPAPVRRDDRWGWTTVLGRFCATSILKPIFQLLNLALMKRNRPRSTTKLASAWRCCEKRAFSSSAAATSSIICMPTDGDGTCPSHTTGPLCSRREFANCWFLKITSLCSHIRINSAAKPSWPCPRPNIICRCFTSSARVPLQGMLHFQ